MYLEIGKQYIVDVTDKGIIPVDEFSDERFFDKDNDDLEFLTDEEKTEVVNKVLADIKEKILQLDCELEDVNYDYNDMAMAEEIHTICREEVLQILDRMGRGE